jgi:hypothetical protein
MRTKDIKVIITPNRIIKAIGVCKCPLPAYSEFDFRIGPYFDVNGNKKGLALYEFTTGLPVGFGETKEDVISHANKLIEQKGGKSVIEKCIKLNKKLN